MLRQYRKWLSCGIALSKAGVLRESQEGERPSSLGHNRSVRVPLRFAVASVDDRMEKKRFHLPQNADPNTNILYIIHQKAVSVNRLRGGIMKI